MGVSVVASNGSLLTLFPLEWGRPQTERGNARRGLTESIGDSAMSDSNQTCHEIVWTLEDGIVSCRAVCLDADCIYRYTCVDGACEWYTDLRREADGSVTHAPWDDGDRQVVQRHLMARGDECNLLLFLNADTSLLPELRDGDGEFEIGRTRVEPVWQVDDGALWRPVQGSGVHA